MLYVLNLDHSQAQPQLLLDLGPKFFICSPIIHNCLYGHGKSEQFNRKIIVLSFLMDNFIEFNTIFMIILAELIMQD